MAFGDRFKNFFGWGDDDDTVYEDESSFDDDLWADFGIDPDNDPDTWFDETPTDDPYGIGSFFNTYDSGGDDDSWKLPTGTVNPWEVEEDDPYGIGSFFDTYDYGLPKSPTVDFEDPDFNWGEFDVDSYLDSLLDPDYGGGTEGDPSDWFINSGDPYNIGETYTEGSDEWDKIMAELSDYDPNIVGGSSGYTGGGAGSPSTITDPTLLKIAKQLGYDPTTQDANSWLNSLSTTITPEAQDTGMFGGGIGPWLRDAFLGKGGLEGKKEGEDIGGILGLLGGLFGKANNAVGAIGGEGGIGGLLNSPLGQLAMLNYMKNKNKDIMDIPVGYGDGGGGGGGDGSPIDYRTFNLQPALMPGVAYANVGKPEGMEHGGLGDVTLAKLEPGEFVVTKKAVDNVGAQNLYKMMKQWEGRG